MVREDALKQTESKPARGASNNMPGLKPVQRQTAEREDVRLRTDARRCNDLPFNEGQQSKHPSAAGYEANDILELAMIESGIGGEDARPRSLELCPHNAADMTPEEIASIERSVRLDHDYAKSFYNSSEHSFMRDSL